MYQTTDCLSLSVAKMATSKPSVESVVFRKLYAKLQHGIQSDLNAFAVDLYSKELITEGTRNNATHQLVDSGSRAIALLNAIEEKITISEGVFWEFLEILEIYRKNLAAELREEFEKFKNKPEQCDGVSEDPDLSVPIEPVQERKEASSGYVPSITVSNGTALTGHCSPQADTGSHRDLTEQVTLHETDAASVLSVGVKPLPAQLGESLPAQLGESLPAQLGESDGNEESTRIGKFTGAVVAAMREYAYVYVSEVQGDYHKRRTKMKQEYAKMDEYYKQQLEHTDQKCDELERELELTRRELEQCKTVHKKETEHLTGQIESREEETSFMVRLCTEQDRKLQQKDNELQEQGRVLQEKDSELQEQDRTLREKDTELQEMKKELVDRDAKLMERDVHIHRVEAELNEMKAQLKQKEIELQEKKQENNLLQGRLEQGVIKQKRYMCKRINELFDQMSKGRNVQELLEVRQRIDRKISELKTSVGHRKSFSWCGNITMHF